MEGTLDDSLTIAVAVPVREAARREYESRYQAGHE
jgi:hypothetical protein